MAVNQSQAAPSFTEVAITFFCWWETLGAAPNIIKTLFRGVIPDCLKKLLLSWNSNPDFWIMAIYGAISFFILLWFLLRHKIPLAIQDSLQVGPDDRVPKRILSDKDRIIEFSIVDNKNKSREQRIEAIIKRMSRRNRLVYILRLLRSFGLVWVREKILDLMKVSLYGTFDRPINWQPAIDRKAKIDRITFTDGRGFEYQYSEDYKQLIVKSHPAGNINYGSEDKRLPLKNDIKILLIASSYFPWWYIRHLIQKL